MFWPKPRETSVWNELAAAPAHSHPLGTKVKWAVAAVPVPRVPG